MTSIGRRPVRPGFEDALSQSPSFRGNRRGVSSARLCGWLATGLLTALFFTTFAGGGVAPPVRAVGVVLMGVLTTLAFALDARIEPVSPFRPGAAGWAVLGFLALGCLGVLGAFYPHKAVATLSLWAAGAGIFAVTVRLARDQRASERMRIGLCCMGGLAGALAISALCLGGEKGPTGGPFVNPNHLAALLAALLPLSIAGIGFGKRFRSSRGTWAIQAVAVLLCLIGLLATQSRGGILAAIVGVGTFALIALRMRRGEDGKRGSGAMIAGLLLAGIIGYGVTLPADADWHRFRAPDAGSESSVAMRWSLWESSLGAIADGGPLGWGLGSYPWVYPAYRGIDIPYRVSHAHNDLLEGTVETGWAFPIAGLAAALILLRRAARGCSAREGSATRCAAAGGIAGLAALTAHALVDFPLQMPSLLWVAAALAGLVAAAGQERKDARPRFAASSSRPLSAIAAAACVLATLLFGISAWREVRAETALDQANIALEALDMERAVTAARRAVGIDPSSAENHAAFGRILMAAARSGVGGRMAVKEALAAFEAAVERNPRDAAAHLDLARTAEVRGDPHVAAKAYERAVALDPRSGVALEAHAAFLLKQGAQKEALVALRASAEADARGLTRVLTQLWLAREDPALLEAVTPPQPGSLIHLGDFLDTQGFPDRAEAAWVSAERLAPGDPAPALRRVRLALRRSQFERAIAMGRAALEKGLTSPALIREMGAALAAAGRLPEAEAMYEKVLDAQPDDKPATRGLAEVRLQRGDTDGAVGAWLSLSRLTPNDTEARFELARVYRRSGAWSEAVKTCSAVIIANPGMEGCRLMVADLYIERDLTVSAERHLRGWIADQPRNVTALTRLAHLYEAAGRWPQARRNYEQVLAIEPDNQAARTALERNTETGMGGAT